MNLSKKIKISREVTVTAGAAAATDIDGTTIDMQGFFGVLFVVQLGAIVAGAVTSFKVQGSDDDSSWDDLEGTEQTIADDDDEEVYYVEVTNPKNRYIRLHVDRATQNATLTALAIQYGAREAPTSHATGISGELHHSPSAGTA